MLRRLLREPRIAGCDLDGADRLALHAAVLADKPLLRRVFLNFHRTFLDLDQRFFGDTPGKRLELGSGVCPVRESDPAVLASDIVPAPHLDLVLDAQDLDLPDGELRAIYAKSVFHHLPDPERFFREVLRVVKPGGGAILIEPYHGPAADFLFKRLFTSEGYDKTQAGWRGGQSGPMGGANQALSYLVFVRDRARYERLFPGLPVVHAQPLTGWVSYLASGGVNFRQLAPNFMAGPLAGVEKMLSPLRRLLALQWVIVLRRQG